MTDLFFLRVDNENKFGGSIGSTSPITKGLYKIEGIMSRLDLLALSMSEAICGLWFL